MRQVFHRLAHDQTESMPFTESRTFAISKNPLRQTGTLRSSKENGLSLSYENPKPHVIIVDDKGLIDRQPGGGMSGRSRSPITPNSPPLTDLYLNLLRGNADKLFDYADVYFASSGIQTWQMGLVRTTPTWPSVRGQGDHLRRRTQHPGAGKPAAQRRVARTRTRQDRAQPEVHAGPDEGPTFFRAPGN